MINRSLEILRLTALQSEVEARLGMALSTSASVLAAPASPVVITYANAPAGSRFTLHRTSSGTGAWPARPSTRRDIYFDWEGNGADPVAATTPGTTTDGAYPGDGRIVTEVAVA